MRVLPFVLLLLVSPFLRAEEFGVLVYGATPAGIAASLAAAADGEKVLLVDANSWVGGMMTNGLTHTDFRTFEGLTGAFLEVSTRVEAHYRATFGADSPQVKECFRGTQAESKVNRAVLEKMLAEQPQITVWLGRSLEAVKCSTDGHTRAVEIAVFADPTGGHFPVTAHMFIDATYEGDLMAGAEVPYRIGREAGEQYAESLAPDEADTQLQGYNFRLAMTRVPANRVMPKAPKGYEREEFTGVLPLLESAKITRLFGTGPPALFKAQAPSLPNGKFDINDVSHGPVRLSLPGENDDWPDGGAGRAARIVGTLPPFSRTGLRQSRERVFDEHLLWNVGLLYFLQNDDAVPAKLRDEAREWGWCKDEFVENGHLPEQLYVREARRMAGAYVFTEKDTDPAPGDARSVFQPDAIAMGDYGPNCHGTRHEGSRFGGKHSGEFYKSVAPYQIPYGVLVPPDVENLLVPVAASSSHVGFCALRLEPIWMSLGQASGHAAHQAIVDKVPVQAIAVERLQKRLHGLGAATIYVSDVPPGDPDFVAVQWWGTAGGLHGLAPAPDEAGQRGKNISGQYYEAFPRHGAGLDKVLDPKIAAAWLKLAAKFQLPEAKLPAADGKVTRGDWIRAAWSLQQLP
ncbi:MAG: hypothetical protein QOE70_1457 [Chthoniobacter sp.]|jgi:hypothetical protein|nr:hypothetical protein [Chthoniobacter sp.]